MEEVDYEKFVLVFSPLVVLVVILSIGPIFANGLGQGNVLLHLEDIFPNKLSSTSTLEEQAIWKKHFTDWAEEKGRIQHISGEITKGSDIIVAGQKIKLPSDAFVKAYIVNDEFLEQSENTKQHLSFYAIQRGNSTIMISENTGHVVNLVLDEADKQPFGFLKGNIRGYLKGVDKVE